MRVFSKKITAGFVLAGGTLVLGFIPSPAKADNSFFSPARSAYNHQQYDVARDDFARELEKNPGDSDAAYGLGNSLYQLGQFQAASAAYQKVLENNPGLEQGWYNLGNSLYKLEDYEDAVRAYQRALQIDPKDQEAADNLALAQKKVPPTPKKESGSNSGKGSNRKKGPDKNLNSKSDAEQNSELQKLLANAPVPNATHPPVVTPTGTPNWKPQGTPLAAATGTPIVDSHGTPVAGPTATPVAGPHGKPAAGASGSPSNGPKKASGNNGSTSAPTEDQQRQTQAKKELGLSDGQVQALLEKMQKQEHQTQQYFSLNPKQEQQNNDPMLNLIPKEQRTLMEQLMGRKVQGGKNEPEEDW